jgi:hypothetical protein
MGAIEQKLIGAASERVLKAVGDGELVGVIGEAGLHRVLPFERRAKLTWFLMECNY